MSEIAERCAPFEADLSALLDGQLDAKRASELRVHAESCRDCAGRLVALRAVDGELRRVAAVASDPLRIEALRSALAARLRAEPAGVVPARTAARAQRAPAQRRRFLAPIAVAAAAAALATLLFVARPTAPVAVPAREIAGAKPAAPLSAADAAIAAHGLNAAIDTPIGASAPSEEEASAAPQPPPASGGLRPWAEGLVELSPETGEKLRAKLEALSPEAQRELLGQILHRAQLTPQQRTSLRERLAQLAVLSPEELDRMLR